MLRNLGRRLVALTVVLAGTVGAPIALWVFGRDLIPDRVPTVTQVWMALITQDNGRTLATAMLLAGTVAWLVFTGCVLLELTARVTRHRPRRLPGLRLPQAAAAALIGLILAGTVTVTGPAPPAALAGPLPTLPTGPVATAALHPGAGDRPVPVVSTPMAPTSVGAPAVAAAPTPASVATGPDWTVRKGDTLWAIAEHTLGDPFRFPEIVDLNLGRAQPDGRTMTSADWLEIGWVLQLPADAHLPSTLGPDTPVTVVAGDTLSGIAEAHGSDTATVWAANTGRPEPGRTRFTDPDLMRPGWTITIPAHTPSTTDATPAPGDPGAAQPVTPLAPAQPPPGEAPVPGAAGPVTPTVTPTSDAPAVGQPVTPTVTPTSDAPAGGQPVTPTVTPTSDGSQPVTPTATGGSAGVAPVTPTPTPTATGAPSTSAGTIATPTTPTSPPATNADTRGDPTPARTSDGAAADTPVVWAVGAAGAALLAGGLALTLRRLRRRQVRHRRPGRVVTATPDGLTGLERAVVTTGAAARLDVDFLDDALRGLQQHTGAAGVALPDVVAARLSAEELELVLHRPNPGPAGPWQVSDDGTRWTLPRTDHVELTPEQRECRVAPYPTLVSVGHTEDGEHWLLDLERIGTVRLTGDPGRCLNLARFIAAELAHHPWSEMLQITVLTDTDELAGMNPERLVVTTDARTALRTAAAQAADIAGSPVDVLAGRAADVTVDAWAPHVLIIDPHLVHRAGYTPELDDLLTGLDRPDRSAVAVLLTTPPATPPTAGGDEETAGADDDDAAENSAAGPGWRIEVDADGTLRVPDLGITCVAEQLPAGEAAQLGQLLRYAADLTDHPAPPAGQGGSAAPAGWEVYADVLGSLLPGPGVSHDRTAEKPLHLAGAEPASSVLPLPPRAYTTTGATTVEDVGRVAPTVTATVRHRVEQADTTLEADLSDWYDDGCRRPRVRVLGPISVRASGLLPVDRPQLAMHTEIVVYLATRRFGATVEQFAADLWPDDPTVVDAEGRPKPKVRQKISTARKWLGDDPDTGRPYLPSVSGMRDAKYRIDGCLYDADLFHRLRARGTARGTDGIPDLQAALRLVVGVPFDQQRPGGYGWLTERPLAHENTAMIVDVAHILATHFLHADQPLAAIDASKVALLAGAFDDITRLDLIAACKANGDTAGADLYLKQLMSDHNADVEEDLPARTLAILDGRDWLTPTRSATPQRPQSAGNG